MLFVQPVAVQHALGRRGTICGRPSPAMGVASRVRMGVNDDKSSTGLGVRVVAGVLAAGLVVTAINPVIQGVRNLNEDPVATSTSDIASDKAPASTTLVSKLQRVPLFTVTDNEDRPYLAESDDKRSRTGYFFCNPDDAELYLSRVEEKAEIAAGARVRIISLADAMQFLGKPLRGKDKVPEKFQLVRDEDEARLANEMTNGQFDKTFKNGVPLFFVNNLALQNENEEQMFPVFFERSKLELFMKKAKESGSKVADEGIEVIDLLQTVKEIRAGANERLKKVEFFSLDRAVEYTQNSINK